MNETRTEVRTVTVNAVCDSCRKGKMIFTGVTNTVNSFTLYRHKCGSCGAITSLGKIYPGLEYKEIMPVKERC